MSTIHYSVLQFSDPDGTLKIAEARASDAGEYTCEVSSDGGNDRHTSHLDVIELPYAPTHVTAEKISTAPKTVNVSWTPGFNGNSPIIKSKSSKSSSVNKNHSS